MAYEELLANRIREALMEQPLVEEKKMFQGLCFMVNDKMCICIRDYSMLCRIGEQRALIELESDNCRQSVMGGRVMKDFVSVDNENVQSNQNLYYWIGLCLDFNKVAKSSKKRRKS